MIITDKIKLLPEGPGVYRYLDEDGVVIYVGKAKNLKKRVAQYFQSPEKLTRKTAVMVSKIRDVEHTVVNSEEDERPTLKEILVYRKDTDASVIEVSIPEPDVMKEPKILYKGSIDTIPENILNMEITVVHLLLQITLRPMVLQ